VTDTETAEPDFDFSSLNPDDATGSPGPLSGSRAGRGTTTGTGTGRGRKSAKSKLDALQTKLSGEMFQTGALVGMGLPTTGYYICQESDNFTKAVVELASTRKEWIEALEHVAMIQPGIMIGRTLIGIGAAFAVDRGRVDPEKQFLKFIGVYSAWKAVSKQGGEVEGSAYRPPPGTFAPVS
jgi:hypothetical protein